MNALFNYWAAESAAMGQKILRNISVKHAAERSAKGGGYHDNQAERKKLRKQLSLILPKTAKVARFRATNEKIF